MLPNNNSLGGGDIHTVSLLNIEGSIPFGEVSWRHICPEVGGTVNVYLKKECLIFGLCLLAPYSCPVGKVLFKGSAVGLRHDIIPPLSAIFSLTVSLPFTVPQGSSIPSNCLIMAFTFFLNFCSSDFVHQLLRLPSSSHFAPLESKAWEIS